MYTNVVEVIMQKMRNIYWPEVEKQMSEVAKIEKILGWLGQYLHMCIIYTCSTLCGCVCAISEQSARKMLFFLFVS